MFLKTGFKKFLIVYFLVYFEFYLFKTSIILTLGLEIRPSDDYSVQRLTFRKHRWRKTVQKLRSKLWIMCSTFSYISHNQRT